MNRRNLLKWTGILSGSTLTGGLAYLENWDHTIQKMSQLSTPTLLARLCYNENPYGPSPAVRKAMISGFDNGYIYPFKQIEELEKTISEKHKVDPSMVVVTAGSREALHAAGLVFGAKGKEILACTPTYKALMTYAQNHGSYINTVPLNANLEYDLDAIEKRISTNTGLIFICNPNNPTGTLLNGSDLRTFCLEASKKTYVFADEVYYDYIDTPNYPSMIPLAKEGRNIIIARTFSKIYGLAGIRVGYLIASPHIASRLRRSIQASTNILGAYAAQAALKETSFFQESLKRNADAREVVYQVCDELGLPYHRSHTNFVFFHTGQPIEKFIGKMRNQGVLVGRPFPPLTDWCRISTGKMEEMEMFAEALKKVV